MIKSAVNEELVMNALRVVDTRVMGNAVVLGLMLSSAVALSDGIDQVTMAGTYAQPTSSTQVGLAQPDQSLDNGLYLYGDVPQANQTGQGYLVFTKQGERVVGAFYYPQSEFSCFTGHLHQQNLAVLSLGSPEEDPIKVEVPLSKMHPIPTVGAIAQESLKACQKEVAAFLQQPAVATSPHGIPQ